MTKNTTLTPDKIGKIENALEERKTKRDRRNKADPGGTQAVTKPDRRTGRDRRDPV